MEQRSEETQDISQSQSFVIVKKNPSVSKLQKTKNKTIKSRFNSKYFSFLIQKEEKGENGKSFCLNAGSCILDPFNNPSRGRELCHLLHSLIGLFLFPSSLEPIYLDFLHP